MTSQLPAYLQNRQSKALANELVANLGVGSPAYVSIMGNKFMLIDSVGDQEPVATFDPKTGPYLDCCIIDSGPHISRIYYEKPFDPNAGTFQPPDCWSDNGSTPSRGASHPQSPTCAACPKAVWGSKISATGSSIPACGSYQKLALAVPGDDVVFLLRIPPNSLKNLREYVHKFNGKDTDISDVLTRISFEPNQLGTLVFQAIKYIDEPTAQHREKVLSAKMTDAMVGKTDLPRPVELPVSAVPALAAPSASPTGQITGVPKQQVVPTQPVTAPVEQSQRRRRRSTAQPEQPAPVQTAPFRQAEQTTAPFGISESVPPNPEIQAEIDGLFK